MSNLNLATAGLKECRITPPNHLIPYLKRWQSNNSPTDLGITRFIFDLDFINRQRGYLPLLKDFRPEYGVAPWASDSLFAVYKYTPDMGKEDRCFGIETYREGSKRQPLDAKILTPNGYKLMGELNVGDEVIGGNGKPTKIVYISETVDRPVYKVQTEDGRSTECDEEHLWYVRKMNSVVNKHVLMTLKEMLKLGICHYRIDKRNGKSYRECNFALETVKPVELKERFLLIEPYTMGLILGDGCISGEWNSVVLSFHKDDEFHYRKQISTFHKVLPTRYDKRNPNVGMFNIENIGQYLKIFGLRGKLSYDKFIPDDYLYGSIEQRKAILEGLMDTDGNVSGKNNNCSRFATVSERLADGVVSLVRSLGGRATKSHFKNNYNGYYGVNIMFTDYIPFRLPRKKNKCKVTTHTFSRIINVELVGNKLGRCIKVDNEDGLYVTDDFILTHNTFWYSFVSPVYDCLVGQYGIYYFDHLLPEMDYQVSRAKNGREAKKKLMNISSFLNSKIVVELFGNMKPSFQEVKSKDAKDTGDLLILSNKYIYEASGIDQPSRGLNLFQMRPKKFTFDDVQNRENTKTEMRREQCDREVMEESFGAVGDDGCIIYIGNRIHADDTLSKIMDDKNPVWKKYRYSLTVKKDGSPGEGDLDNEVPEWKARWTIERIRKRKRWFIKQPKLGGIRGYLKEYYNILKSESNYRLHTHNAMYFNEFGLNWLKIPNPDGTFEITNVHIGTGVDPAISKKKGSSNAVTATIAVASDGRRFVLQYSSGKFELYDRPLKEHEEYFKNVKLATEAKELMMLEKIGTVGEIGRHAVKYRPDGVCVESGVGVQETFFIGAQDMLNNKLMMFPTLLPYTPDDDKEYKLRQVPLGYVELGMYYIRESMVELKNEVESFGEGSRKDILDAIHNAEMVLRIPTKIEYNPLGVHLSTEEDKKQDQYNPEKRRIDGLLTKEFESWIVY